MAYDYEPDDYESDYYEDNYEPREQDFDDYVQQYDNQDYDDRREDIIDQDFEYSDPSGYKAFNAYRDKQNKPTSEKGDMSGCDKFLVVFILITVLGFFMMCLLGGS